MLAERPADVRNANVDGARVGRARIGYARSIGRSRLSTWPLLRERHEHGKLARPQRHGLAVVSSEPTPSGDVCSSDK